jgi:hypothetical protein
LQGRDLHLADEDAADGEGAALLRVVATAPRPGPVSLMTAILLLS